MPDDARPRRRRSRYGASKTGYAGRDRRQPGEAPARNDTNDTRGRPGRPPGRDFPHRFQVGLDPSCDRVVRAIMRGHRGCSQNEAVRMAVRVAAEHPPQDRHRDRIRLEDAPMVSIGAPRDMVPPAIEEPCPFCGSTDITAISDTKERCNNCGAEGDRDLPPPALPQLPTRCPFCSGADLAVTDVADAPYRSAVDCETCGAKGPVGAGKTKQASVRAAIELWARRACAKPADR